MIQKEKQSKNITQWLLLYIFLGITSAIELGYFFFYRYAHTGIAFFTDSGIFNYRIITNGFISQFPFLVNTLYNDVVPFSLSNIIYTFMFQMQIPLVLYSLFLGVSTVLLFAYVIQCYFIEKRIVILTTIIFLFSPVYFLIFGTLSSIAHVFLFVLLLLLALHYNKKIISYMLVFFIASFGVEYFIFLLFLLFFVYLQRKQKRVTLVHYIISILGVFFFVICGIFSSFQSFLVPITFSFMEFGELYGYPIMLLLLFVISLLYFWKRTQSVFFSSILLFGVVASFVVHLNVLFEIILIIFVSLLLNSILAKKWDVEASKYASVALIVIQLFATFFFFLLLISTAQPTDYAIQAFTYLHDNTEDQGYVFTAVSVMPTVEAIAYRKVFQNSLVLPENSQKNTIIDDIYYSTDLSKTYTLLQTYNIRYIVLTEQMKHGEIWNRDMEGLLLLLTNTRYFEKIYDTEDYEIYMVLLDE